MCWAPRRSDDGGPVVPRGPMSNDQQTPVSPTTDESLADAVAQAHKKLEQPAIWPGNVPSQLQALEVLCGKRTLAISDKLK